MPVDIQPLDDHHVTPAGGSPLVEKRLGATDIAADMMVRPLSGPSCRVALGSSLTNRVGPPTETVLGAFNGRRPARGAICLTPYLRGNHRSWVQARSAALAHTRSRAGPEARQRIGAQLTGGSFGVVSVATRSITTLRIPLRRALWTSHCETREEARSDLRDRNDRTVPDCWQAGCGRLLLFAAEGPRRRRRGPLWALRE